MRRIKDMLTQLVSVEILTTIATHVENSFAAIETVNPRARKDDVTVKASWGAQREEVFGRLDWMPFFQI